MDWNTEDRRERMAKLRAQLGKELPEPTLIEWIVAVATWGTMLAAFFLVLHYLAMIADLWAEMS